MYDFRLNVMRSIYFLITFLLLSFIGWSQKYALLDRKMIAPIAYSNTITVAHDYQNLFPVEKEKLSEFISTLENIVKMLNEKKIPASVDYNVGTARFKGTKFTFPSEERIDIILTSACSDATISMHLVDAKMSNATNAYNISTWIKYIKKESSTHRK
jgi:hypothetical protein